jgi:hypothetical protein
VSAGDRVDENAGSQIVAVATTAIRLAVSFRLAGSVGTRSGSRLGAANGPDAAAADLAHRVQARR